MAETDDADSLLEAFSRKTIARLNLRSLDGEVGKQVGRSDLDSESDEDENDRPPFKPSSF